MKKNIRQRPLMEHVARLGGMVGLTRAARTALTLVAVATTAALVARLRSEYNAARARLLAV